MLLKKMATMAAALSLVAGSVAPAFAAQPLSLDNSPTVRASAETGASSYLDTDRDDTWMQLAGLAAVALIILGIVLLLDDDVDLNQPLGPTPTSP
jgi:hypothetical protein